MASFCTSSVGRKFLMALSAVFLIIFLIIHVSVNLVSVCSPEAFNEASEFMGKNGFIQFVGQPILFAGVIFHFVMGFILEIKNKQARGNVRYAVNSSSNASWMSKNMIISGAVILLFIGLHLVNFWVPTVKAHYVDGVTPDYYEHLHEHFANPIYTGVYILAFIALALHLMHGFQSAFQSMGVNHKKYTPVIMKLGTAYSIIVPALFIFIALFHFVKSL